MVDQACAWVALKMLIHPSGPQFTPLWDQAIAGSLGTLRIQVCPRKAARALYCMFGGLLKANCTITVFLPAVFRGVPKHQQQLL